MKHERTELIRLWHYYQSKITNLALSQSSRNAARTRQAEIETHLESFGGVAL